MLGMKGSKYSIYIYEEDFKDKGRLIEHTLYEEGYHNAYHWSYWACPWMWVSLDLKRFAWGRPGVGLAHAYRDHAVTVEEFYKIKDIYDAGIDIESSDIVNEIYKKYEGLDLRDMGYPMSDKEGVIENTCDTIDDNDETDYESLLFETYSDDETGQVIIAQLLDDGMSHKEIYKFLEYYY